MSDKLKDFVQAHREEFDSFTPRPDLWQDIAAELPAGQTAPQEASAPEAKVFSLNWNTAWRYAAAVALLVTAAFVLRYLSVNNGQPSAPLAANGQPVTLEKIAPELRQMETRYVQVIEKKESKLKAMGAEVQFAELDSAYNELKKELYTTPNKEVLLQAMGDNLKMRIALLNQQLEVVEHKNSDKKLRAL
ncbi:hypothetical protein [Rufibacter soli]